MWKKFPQSSHIFGVMRKGHEMKSLLEWYCLAFRIPTHTLSNHKRSPLGTSKNALTAICRGFFLTDKQIFYGLMLLPSRLLGRWEHLRPFLLLLSGLLGRWEQCTGWPLHFIKGLLNVNISVGRKSGGSKDADMAERITTATMTPTAKRKARKSLRDTSRTRRMQSSFCRSGFIAAGTGMALI